MAIALVGGIAVSTLLTLFVVPAAYSILDDAVVWNEERRRRGASLPAGLASLFSRRETPATSTAPRTP
jgi:uncharacterized membrane protein YdfJ with MMPL/SSD domain